MVDRIRKLESIALRLEPSAEGRAYMRDKVVAYAEEFLSKIDDLPAYIVTEDKGIGIYD